MPILPDECEAFLEGKTPLQTLNTIPRPRPPARLAALRLQSSVLFTEVQNTSSLDYATVALALTLQATAITPMTQVFTGIGPAPQSTSTLMAPQSSTSSDIPYVACLASLEVRVTFSGAFANETPLLFTLPSLANGQSQTVVATSQTTLAQPLTVTLTYLYTESCPCGWGTSGQSIWTVTSITTVL